MIKLPKIEFFKSKTDLSNMSHAVLASLFFSITFLLVAFFTDNSENYIFPRLLSILLFMLTLILWLGDDNMNKIRYHSSLFPGVFIVLIYILLLEDIGFYAGSFLIFILLTLIYRDKNQKILHNVAIKLITATLFTTVLYILFSTILQIRIPSGELLSIIF